MIFKIIGQFLFAATILQFMPADAAFLEFQAGVPDVTYPDRISAEQAELLTAVLPQAEDRFTFPVKVDTDSYGIVTTAQSVLVTDVQSGMILPAKHPDQVRSIGSVTKLMTVLIFLEQEVDLSQIVRLDPELDLVEGGRIYLGFHTGISLEDVLGASIIGSDNSATQALVRFVGLSQEEFVNLMNEKAEQLGMTSTTFTDPTGIHSSNRSTARDLVLLLEAAQQNEIIHKFSMMSQLNVAQSNGRVITIENTNKLLSSFLNQGDYQILGGKTGFLPEAGYVLATTVQQGEKKIHVIVLGSESKETRVKEVKGLASWAFRVFQWPN